jgi:uncharacterized protein (TIGR00269 family)
MIKRYALNYFAATHGFDKVATGHNLTDEVTSLVVNFFNGDIHYLQRSLPIVNSEIDMLVPRIKPLFYIAEQEIIMYAYYNDIQHIATECEYSPQSPNIDIKRILQDLDDDRRGMMLQLMKKYQKVLLPLIKAEVATEKTQNIRQKKCLMCGMPTNHAKCAFCRQKTNILERIRQWEKFSKTLNEPSKVSSIPEISKTEPSTLEPPSSDTTEMDQNFEENESENSSESLPDQHDTDENDDSDLDHEF